MFRPNDRRPPVTVSFGTTPRVEQGSNHDEVESGTVVSQGKIGEGFRRNQSLSPRVTQEIFKHTISQRPHQIVTPSQLAKMRNGLIDAGIGELTRLDSGSPPANTAFIRVATKTGQVTFLNPPRLTRQDSDTTARDKRAKMDIWTRCILAMKSGTLRTDFIPGLRTNSSP